ncbi:MAG: hypothetical protein HQM13_14135 [SAR324 cluster bacterium]|nr:hypothetical protein [SAR324 cluster bacterium]
MHETDLYPAMRKHLIQKGYDVKSEIQHCDIVAVRGGDPVLVVELKLSINLRVLLQAVDRLQITDTVYIGVPKGIAVMKKQRKQVVKLVRMLGLGLIEIDPSARIGGVDVLFDPGAYKPRQVKRRSLRLMNEFNNRTGDPNLGGSSSRIRITTAYRQKAVAIADYLLHNGDSKAATIAHALSEPKTRAILYRNVYGWFIRHGKGIYGLSSQGKSELPQWS